MVVGNTTNTKHVELDMKLLTKKLEKSLPGPSMTNEQGPEALARVKLFTPWADWTWYITEYTPDTEECYGLVVSPTSVEYGYFHLDELRKIDGPFYLKVERDLHFSPVRVGDIREKARNGHRV